MDLSTPNPPPGSHSAAQPLTPAQAARPAPASDDPLDILLKQIVGGWFILTDSQGVISKWGEPAELLFGRDAGDALGHPFFERLLAGPLSDDAEQWRRFLAAGDAPRARALVEVGARHAESDTLFPLEAVFVPVKLDEGFDFSLFLEDLSFELPMNLMLTRMRRQHPVVVRAMQAAIEETPQAWDGWRTAGTMVAFRPLAPTPWVELGLVRREQERARADAEREAAMTVVDLGPQGEVGDLEDAAAVIARLLSAVERIDELERVGQERKVPERAAEQQRLDLAARLERLEQERSEAARSELSATLDRVAREHDRELEATRAGLAAALQRIDAVQHDAERLSERLAAVAIDRHADGALAGEDRRRLEELQREGEQARVRLDGLHALADELRAESVRGGQTADALRAELDAMRASEGDALAAARAHAGRELEAMRSSAASTGDALESLRTELEAMRAADHDARADLRRLRDHVAGLSADEQRVDLEPLVRRIMAIEGDESATRDQLAQVLHRLEQLAAEPAPRAELEELRAEVGALRASGPDPQLDELRRHVEQLRERTVARSDFDALERAFEALREGGVGRTDLEAIRGQLATLADGWAAKGELDALRGSLVALSDSTPARAELEALRAELSDARRAAAGREELDALRGQLDQLREQSAALTELDAIGERLDGLAPSAALDLLAAELKTLRDGAAARTDVERLRRELSDGGERVRALAIALEALRDGGVAPGDVEELRGELETLRQDGGQMEALRAAELDRAAKASGDRVEEIAGLSRAAHEAASAARADAERVRAETHQLRREQAAGYERLESTAADVGRVERELTAFCEQAAGEAADARRAQADALQSGVERIAEHVAAGRVESEARAAELLLELAVVRRVAEQAGSGVAELRAELRDVRTLAELANAVAEKSRMAAEEQLLATKAEVARDPGEQAAQVFREMLGLAATSRPGMLQKPLEKPVPDARAARPGFDDDPAPMAVIGIDGRFQQLNPSFCRLVGYQEHEFAKALWPSPHDRLLYARQQLQFADMVAGRLERVAVESTFMHGQGLMVPIVGEITAVKGADGRPSHLLLRAGEHERAV